jgi:uncharacterized repeat protein (TIGR01451 family)
MRARRGILIAVLTLVAVNVVTILALGAPKGGCGGGYSGYSGYSGRRAHLAGYGSGSGSGGSGSGGYGSGYSSYGCETSDLQVVLTDHPDPVLAGGNLTYRAEVYNHGPDYAFDAFVEHFFSEQVKVLSVVGPPGATCESYSRYAYCSFYYIRPDHKATVDVTIRAPADFTVNDQATAYSSSFDPNFNDNHQKEVTRITQSADMSVTNFDSPDPVKVRQPLTYSIVVQDQGPFAADGVVLTDPLPVGFKLVAVTPSQGTCSVSAGLVTCDLGSIGKGQLTTVTIVGKALTPGTLTDTASVTATTGDANPANNSFTQTTTVQP